MDSNKHYRYSSVLYSIYTYIYRCAYTYVSYIAKPVKPPYKHEKNKNPCIVLTPSVGMLENSDPAIAPIIRFWPIGIHYYIYICIYYGVYACIMMYMHILWCLRIYYGVYTYTMVYTHILKVCIRIYYYVYAYIISMYTHIVCRQQIRYMIKEYNSDLYEPSGRSGRG